MNQEKIGKYIRKLRIEANLSQSQLAEKLSVTNQAVSKWETGRGIPDIEMLKRLSEIFNVDISSLISGEKSQPKPPKISLIIFSVFLCIVLFIFALYFLSKNTYNFSSLASDNNAFQVKGIMVADNNKKSIYISQIEYANKSKQEREYIIMECILYEEVKNTERKISQCGNLFEHTSFDRKDPSTLSELLKDVSFNVDNYSCSCKKANCNNLFLKVNALNVDNNIVTYKIPLQIAKECSK